MAEIIPFRLVHYNGTCAQKLDNLITPPYDIISPSEQEEFYRLDPCNMIRLVLGKQLPNDSGKDNRYTRAATTLKEWMSRGVLVREEIPSLTVYQMEFQNHDGDRGIIDGVVALVKVDEYGIGKVLPHEKTYKGPKQDQLNLLKACRSHLTPIHGLFNDKDNEVTALYADLLKQSPQQIATDRNGDIHRTWTMHDESAITKVQEVLADKSILIADGHHRYETSLAFKKEMIEKGVSDAKSGHEYVMMYLTSMSHPGLRIYPAHRMVKGLSEIDVEKVLNTLARNFEIEVLCLDNEDRKTAVKKLVNEVRSMAGNCGNYGIVIQGEPCFRLLKLKNFDDVDPLIDSVYPSSLRDLDVTILREVIMGLGFGIDRHNAEGMIEYTPSAYDALERVEQGDIQVAFIINPTRVDQVQSAAELGHKLPHKSTYFYPKLSSGLVINVF
jgi:uncharacterized protein (DUF1015 family)